MHQKPLFNRINIMRQDFEKLFTHLVPPELPDGLFAKIMSRINNEKRQLARKRLVFIFSLFGLVGSLAAFIPTLNLVKDGFVSSGFITFFSLLFSDSEIVLVYWQSFMMSLLESLPVVSIVVLLAIVLVFLESLRFLARNARFVFKPSIIIN